MPPLHAGQQAVRTAADWLRPRLPRPCPVAVVLGSGLGPYAERSPAALALAYADIPGFPPCTVEGHRGRLLVREQPEDGTLLLQGRVHAYEGRSLEEVTRSVRILAAVGVHTLILSCAAGSVAGLPVGSVLLVADHLNLLGANPLTGRHAATDGGGGFVGMADAYDPELLALADTAAQTAGLRVTRGVLACLPGPSYETPAEAAMLRGLGAHAVTMSTVPEVIVARSLGMRVLAFALITNESGVPLRTAASHQAVLAAGERTAARLGTFLDDVLLRLSARGRGRRSETHPIG